MADTRKCIRRRQWHPTPVLLPGKSHGRRSLEGCSPWGRWGSDTTERLHFHFSLSCIGEGNGNPLQCSCLENPRDGGAWWAAVYGVAQSQTRLKRLSSSSSIMLPVSSMNQNSDPFNCWIIFHCVCIPYLYPFVYQWTFRLLLYVGRFLTCVLYNILYHHYYFIVIGTLNSRDFIPYLWHNALHKTGHTRTSPSILMTK